MSVRGMLADLADRGVELTLGRMPGTLRWRDSRGCLTEADFERLRAAKLELLALLRAESGWAESERPEVRLYSRRLGREFWLTPDEETADALADETDLPVVTFGEGADLAKMPPELQLAVFVVKDVFPDATIRRTGALDG